MNASVNFSIPEFRSEHIGWQTDRRTIVINGCLISLTRTEHQLLRLLRLGCPVTYAELAMSVYGCKVDAKVRMMLDKHIDRIRYKLRASGMYVYCVLSYGYILLFRQMHANKRASA